MSEQSWIHRTAGMATSFAWQDDGKIAQVEEMTILGKLPDQEVWIVEVAGIATNGVANGEYWWPIKEYVAVYKHDDGTPTCREATDAEINSWAEQP